MSNVPGGPFRKGDPRINRKGRPKVMDEVKSLSLEIAHEPALKDGQPIVINGHVVTVVEAILRQWAVSKNPKLQELFMLYAFGKIADNVNVNANVHSTTAEIKGVDYRAIASALAPGPVPDSDPSSEDQSSRDGSQVG